MGKFVTALQQWKDSNKRHFLTLFITRTKCVDNKAEAGVATVLRLEWQFLSSMFVSVQDKLSEAG